MNQSPELPQKHIVLTSEKTPGKKSLLMYEDTIREITQKENLDRPEYVQYIQMIGEVSELGEALTVHQGDRASGSGNSAMADNANMTEEIGDVFFSLCQISDKLGVHIDEAMDTTFVRYDKKLEKLRKSRGQDHEAMKKGQEPDVPTQSLSVDALQNKINTVATSFEFNWSNYVQFARLVEETGELGEALLVHKGDWKSAQPDNPKSNHADLREEIGDIFFTLAQLSNQLGIKLEDAIDMKIKKHVKSE